MKKYKLIKSSIAGIIFAISLSGCAKKMDCNIDEKHVHLYINSEDNSARYYNSEKETKDIYFYWTKKYHPINEKMDIIIENELYLVRDNLEYLRNELNNHQPKREEYVYDYIYGPHLDYGYILDAATGQWKYGFGLITEYHWDYVWNEISMDEYTDNKVRDYTYEFRFYKIEKDGTISSKKFKSLENIEEGYDYFKPSDLIEVNIGSEYWLEKPNVKTKTR